MKSLNEWIKSNIQHNQSQDYSHIQDPYFKEKLDKGYTRYAPEEWAELTPFDERSIE